MKKQLKKSLSLFLAVLMLMSCWVWVAPEKASADNTAGQYKVKITAYVATYCANGSANFVLNYSTSNGTVSGGSKTISKGTGSFGSGVNGTTVTIFEDYIDGFPTSMTVNMSVSGRFKTLDLENVQVFVYNHTTSSYVAATNADNYELGSSYHSSASASFTVDRTADLPVLTTADSMGSTSLTCPAIGSTSSNSTTATIPTYWDQYGVKWIASVDPAYHISATENGDELENTGTAGGFYTSKDGTKGKVTVTADMQVTFPPKSSSSKDYYMVATVTNSSNIVVKSSQKITVNFTKYTFTFNGDGSVSSLGSIINDKSGNKLGTGSYAPSGYYGYDDKTFPTNESVTAEGYTFMGFWTTKQPTSGYASYNAKESEFAYPCSSSDYTAYKDAGATESDGVVTVTENGVEKKYYDAGTAWDTTINIIDKNRTYYGWWLAEDLTVKFYDIDGVFKGEYLLKYGQTQSALTWPDSSYSQAKPYVSGSFTAIPVTGVWENIDGEVVNQNGYKFTHNLILTPQTTNTFTSTYNITFVSPNADANGNATNIGEENGITYTNTYKYRTEAAVPADRDVPDEISLDLQYSYEFIGWSSKAPLNGRYHILLEDGDFDVEGNAVGLNSDWLVRNEATYYAVYRRHTRSYTVKFFYYDATATYVSRTMTVKYGDKITPPIDYVPYTYATGGYGFTFANWQYTDSSAKNAKLGYADSIVLNKDNLQVLLGAVSGAGGAITFLGQYGEGVPTPYTVTFKYVDENGEPATYEAQVNHGSEITDDIVDALDPVDEYDNGEALVSFTDTWKVLEGVAAKDEYGTNDLTSVSPTSHITFEAVYGNPRPFYTVTYVDGANTYSERVLTGTTLPAWTYEVTDDGGTPDDETDDTTSDKEYVPVMADDAKGSYIFQGWYDAKQTDTSYNTMNGNKYEATTEITSNVTLYPQFKFRPFTYEIKFMDYSGETVLASGSFEYGQNIEALTAQAVAEAEKRTADETYSYLFIGWDLTVPTICEGKEMTFIAQYKPVYVYYKANWYNGKLEDGKWEADTAEGGLLATTSHTYNSKLYAPSVDGLVCGEVAPDGQSYVFAGWYTVIDGEAVKYTRGMLITEEMDFYATYTLTAVKRTVTTVVNGVSTKYTVADGSTVEISDPTSGYVDESKHNAFDGWYTDEAYTTEFDIENTEITADITIYAKFTESAHDYSNKELKTAPTYYEKGVNTVWCSCDKDNTKKEEEIALLTDNVKPTGTIYLGTLGSWSSASGAHGNATDGEEVSLFANADTDIIITANDTGDVNDLYNPAGIGMGISYIKAFVFPADVVLTSQNYGAAQSLAYTVYSDDTQNLNNTANFTVKLGDLVVADLADDGTVQYEDDGTIKQKALEDGETYIVYYFVRDKAGNQLTTRVRTAKFAYDTTAPTFDVEGEGNADEITAGTPTYCESATVKNIENGATLTVNGEVAVATDGAYEIDEAGNYLITVTDKAGNSYSKKIKVAGGHSLHVTTQTLTCTRDGYEKTVCIVCGHVENEETTTAIGHVYDMPTITPATCTENGYAVRSCQNCDYTEKLIYEVDEDGNYTLDSEGKKIYLYPAEGHAYETDADGNIVYTTVTEPTCKSVGKAIANCTVCGAGTITTEIAVNPDAHKLGTLKTLDPSCTVAGETYRICKLCTARVKVSDIGATGHTRDNWVVTTEATCYADGVETETCPVCQAVITTDGEANTRAIAATGKHVSVVAESKDATADEEGYIIYECAYKADGCNWTETVTIDKLVEYTVTFTAEDGSVITAITKTVGEGIEETAVSAPEKTDSTGKYKYTFAGWADENGTVASFPYTVTADITLKATYTQSTILYTHQFMVPTSWTTTLDTDSDTTVEFTTLMGSIGDVRVPSATPTFTHYDAETDAELKKLYTFEFAGWTDVYGNIVTDFTIALGDDGTKESGDKTFYAKFEATPISYKVIYYNGTDLVWNTEVDGGEVAEYANYDSEGSLILPEKNYDTNNHYAFDKWYTNNTLTVEYKGEPITADTRLYAGFTATEHSYDRTNGTVVQEKNCTAAELTEYECSCGHTITEETAEALGHDMGEYSYDEATGMNVRACSRCEYTESVNASCTIKFVNDSGLTLELVSNVKIGNTVKYSKDTPVKNATSEYTFEFAGWVDEAGNKYAADAEFIATADAVYTAYYNEINRVYRVSYVSLDNEIIKYTDENGTTVSCTYELNYKDAVPAYPDAAPAQVKAADDGAHYVFTGWSVEAGTEVTADVAIRPVFTSVAHTWEKTDESTGATCEQAGGDIWRCTGCGLEKTQGGTPATGHKMVQTSRVEPDYDNGVEGYVIYSCKNGCGKTEKTTLSAALIDVVITVNDANGNPKQGVEVALVYAATPNVAVDGTHTLTTGADGKVTFHVKPGDYLAKIGTEFQSVTVDNDRNVTGGTYTEAPEEVVVPTCSCSCHRDGFWGIVFRFFHKIIAFFAGDINCCSCPDDRY